MHAHIILPLLLILLLPHLLSILSIILTLHCFLNFSHKVLVLEGLLGCYSFFWIIPQTLLNQVEEVRIDVVAEERADGLTLRLQRSRAQRARLATLENVILLFLAPEVKLREILPLFVQMNRYIAEGNYEEFQQLILILRWEQRRVVGDLEQDASDAPDVHGVLVGALEYYLRRSVHAALHIAEAELVILATGAKIDELDVPELVIDEENVLGLDVAVNHALVFHVF